MEEYEIEDSIQNTMPISKEKDRNNEMFCNSQDFFDTQDDIKLPGQEKNTPQVDMGNINKENSGDKNNYDDKENSFKSSFSDESSEEITKKKKLIKKPGKVMKKSTPKPKTNKSKLIDKNNSANNDNKIIINNENNKVMNDNSFSGSNSDIKKNNNEYKLTNEMKKIFDFLYNINRPVSITELALNFKKQITSIALQEICVKLEEKGLIIIKLFSKTRIYMISPSVFDMSESETNKEKLKIVKKENDKLKNKLNVVLGELRSYKSMDTEEVLEKKIEEVKVSLLHFQEKVNLRDRGLLVTKKEIEEYTEKTKKYIKISKERRKIVNEMLSLLCENLNMKKKDLCEELELEL